MPLKPKSKLASLREKAGLTQVQLAVLVGVTPNTIQNWEKDNGLDQLERYLKLAELFGCNVSDLVEYVPVPEEEKSKSKGFSLEELGELRERWGTSTKAKTPYFDSKPESQTKVDKNQSSV
ncbi:helix-turn-helix transcriptional regulator (plasmid) [Nostoc sp. UHCC 0926]|uniref:helix-turn-helix transcriptional regulator n=1 Tax=Nostoc sp. UHCC 0926 TaxID=3025190 RepID=UPI0023619852|nr:helix-turn-helix transcriptional regulator [Nostoc sp. UHCC 0926]WDD36076.1 helix-turn-helix transcriptional regulator [Nostoc sp. UHCC 0926]